MARETMNTEQKKKFWEEKTKPVICNSLEDIKRALTPFLQSDTGKSVEFSCDLTWRETDSQKAIVEKVKGTSADSSMRSLLIDGMDIIKRRLEAAVKIEQAIKTARESGEELPTNTFKIWEIDNVRFQVDALIERKLGGKRAGLRIRWKVAEGVFEFDPYTMKLFKQEPQ